MRRFKKAFVMLMACVMSMAFAVTAHAEEDVKAAAASALRVRTTPGAPLRRAAI